MNGLIQARGFAEDACGSNSTRIAGGTILILIWGFVLLGLACDARAGTGVTYIGSSDTPDEAQAVVLAGNTAYVADAESGVLILDISDPTTPVLLGSYDTHNAVGVEMNGTTAYLADQDPGMKIVDLSNQVTPVSLGSYDPGDAYDVAVQDGMAYIAGGSGGSMSSKLATRRRLCCSIPMTRRILRGASPSGSTPPSCRTDSPG